MSPIPPSLDKTRIVYLFIWNQFFLFQQRTGPRPAKMVLKWLKGQKERTTYFTSCEQGYFDHTKPVTPGTRYFKKKNKKQINRKKQNIDKKKQQ